MPANKIGGGLVILGIVSILIFAFLSGGMPALRASLILGVEISVIIILLGIRLILADKKENIQEGHIGDVVDRILNFPVIVWVLTSFLVVYLLLFISPIFLNRDLQMNYYTDYIPNLNPIGNDLTVMVDQIKGWVATNQSPYKAQFYPPLTYVLFSPLLLIKDYPTLYRFLTLFTFVNYCFLTLLLPLIMVDKKNVPLILLFFITGLFSYGFQFELERGQYNVFTFLLCLLSIYIFHQYPRYRLVAYFLFSLSIQLKLYPAIFIVMFVDDWRDWKNVALRFAGIGVFNFLLLFVMGTRTFLDFTRAVFAQITSPAWIGVANHSISSFVSTLKSDGLGLMDINTLRTLRHNSDFIGWSLILLFAVCFLIALLIFHLRKASGIDPYLLLICTIGAMILPISYDYTLSILATPVVLFLTGLPEMKNSIQKLAAIILILGISLAYASTLIPYRYRPHTLNNIFPSLFLILILVTSLNIIRYKSSKEKPVES